MMQIKVNAKLPDAPLTLERFDLNPILSPISGHLWETKGVFNPAAVYEGGKVHLLYRAIGETDVSVLGYASSIDGLHIDERLEYPVYVPREPFEGVNPSQGSKAGLPGPYVSGGGGTGGCEDPRLTRIDDKLYLTYVAYDGHSHPRVALSSINLDDFLNKRWRWKTPVLISRPHIVNKNACILPEKVRGKYVIFHRVFPNILVDFVDDLDFDGKTRWLEGQYRIPVGSTRSDWDNLKVGCGPPPIRTREGWLMIYQAVGRNDESRYKIGAMLLDIDDPTKVIARSRKPILEPLASYENEGFKFGVVYPCGAAVIDKRLYVYYGGADYYVCVATAQLEDFMFTLETCHGEKNPVNIPVHDYPAGAAFEGFCMKCRRTHHIDKPHRVLLKNRRQAIQGFCSQCGSRITRFIKAPFAPGGSNHASGTTAKM